MTNPFSRGIRNTARLAKEEPLSMLVEMMGGDGVIERQEARGQAELCESTSLPTDGSKDRAFEKMGITFGPPNPGDPMFRPATLPAGWKVVPTDHSMWSKLVDAKGCERASIFYKAAFYDRSAHISPVCRYVATNEYPDSAADSNVTRCRSIVRDNATGEVVYATPWINRFGNEYPQDYHEARRAGQDETEAWVKKNFPNWRDAAAYWD